MSEEWREFLQVFLMVQSVFIYLLISINFKLGKLLERGKE